MAIKDGDIVEVSWLDAELKPDNIPDDIGKTTPVPERKNVGYWLGGDDSAVRLGFGISHNDPRVWDTVIIIPQAVVTHMTVIE